MSSNASSERTHYSLKALKNVPRRLFRPPTPTIGCVRSFRLTPCFQVTVEDVINAKHLPPLGRKEFEEYLLYKEYSIENLYFWLWFEDYKTAYFEWQRSAPDLTIPSPSLTLSYSRAKETFFTHARPYELNLTEKTVQELVTPTRPHNGPRQHPHPDAFAAVKYEVDGFLNEALRRFTANFSGNAGRNRGLFAVVLGTLVLACGALPILFSVLSARAADRAPPHVPHLARAARLASIPVLWLGFFALLAGLQGVCVVIFLFGDVRQLHAYELAKPRISPPLRARAPLGPGPGPVRVGLRRGVSLAGSLEEGTLGGGAGGGGARSASLFYAKGGEIDMGVDVDLGDDGHAIMLELTSGTLAGTASESGISLDKIAPAPLHASPNPNPNANANVNINAREHPHTRISVDITQRPREGSMEITLAQTVEDDVYRIDTAPMSDTTIAVERRAYAPSANYFGGQGPQYSGGYPYTYSASADADTAPYRFDFDALPLPAGMTLPPWPQTRRAPPIAARRVGMMGMGIGRGLTERRVFAPLARVASPLITRAQWVIVVRSALLGLVLACAIGGASMAIC